MATLSGGQAKRVALARVLAAPGELLVLDEPTNHLDLAAVAWLEDWLAAYPGGLVVVSHDRYLLDRVTTRMLELDRGTGHVHDGGYASYLEGRAEREEQAAVGRVHPAQPGPERAGLAPARRQGPEPQAPGPGHRGPGPHRTAGGRGGPARRPRARGAA